MKAFENTNKQKVPPPSWIGVRSIYKKLSDEFSVLTNTFNVVIDEERRLHLDHLIIAIDEIDTCIDELPTRKERDSITNSLVDFLSTDDDHWNHPNETPALSKKIENLNKVVRQLNVRDEFIAAAKTIFLNTELKRHTKETNELINFVTLEGKATAILPLSIMGVKSETTFGTFFTNLCMLMGIVDLIFDAREDYKQGYIALKPNWTLYTRLIKIAVIDGLSLLFNIPRKIQFARYCLRMAYTLIKG